MTRYLGFVRMAEGITEPPPPALMEAMGEFMGKATANGTMLDGGGLFGTEDSVNFVIRTGEVTRVDGPYAEAKEVVGGWALLQFETPSEAVAAMQEMAQLHADHWPEQEVVISLRQCVGEPT